MRPYSIEIFSNEFLYRSHTNIDPDDYEYQEDYLDPEQNCIEVVEEPLLFLNDYIRVKGNGIERWGIITKIDRGNSEEKNITKITYKDFSSILDIDAVVNVSDIGTGSLENYIAQQISKIFIEGDNKQKINGLYTSVETETRDWTLDIADDAENVIVNLFDDIVLPAFKKYGVRTLFDVDISSQKIKCSLSVCQVTPKQIEADLPNVLSKQIKYRNIKKELNKVTIYNKKEFDTELTYYLHPDGSYDLINDDRITPVVFKLETVSINTAEEYAEKYEKTLDSAVKTIKSCQNKLDKGEELDSETVGKEVMAAGELNTVPGVNIFIDTAGRATGFDETVTQAAVDEYILSSEYSSRMSQISCAAFTAAADDSAAKAFAANKYENNIEIECVNGDTLIGSDDMEIGQIVNIISNGKTYTSIFTGKKITDTTLLIFGNVRIELTKILKGRS